jgi:hypothetical protein
LLIYLAGSKKYHYLCNRNIKSSLKMKTCKKQNECTTYPFCYDCEAWCGTTQELQQEINNFFKGRPYRVQLDIPSFDEFEETLYKFVRTYGDKFHDCNTKEVATQIKEITKKLKSIQAREGNKTGVATKESLENVVDLGLPSGTLWAKCNLGAEKETDFGLFYQWGDTKGYKGVDEHQFSWNDYKWGTPSSLNKYNGTDGKLVLDNDDDPVYVATDGKMKSPIMEQLQELIIFTNHEWANIDGVKGMKFINKNDDTKYIFIPAAGNCGNGSHEDVGSWGFVWSASRNASNTNNAWCMSFDSGNVGMSNGVRYLGFSVRGVVAPEGKEEKSYDEGSYDKIDDTDDGQPVDLGLPSGTKWMKSNIGATKPSDFGKFFLWGDTQGHSGVDEHQFDWDDYKWGSYKSLTKYNDTDQLTLLEPSDDSAFVATSGQTSMPTKGQFQELIDNTEHRWLSLANGVNGMKFWKKSTEEPTDGNSYIFIPAAGYCYYGSHYDVGSWGNVWSASRDESYAVSAWSMYFNAGGVNMGYGYRCYGFSVRAVMVPEDKVEEPYDNIDDTDDGQPVDLGLPSGTLWMKSNLGATKPSDFGLFYQWGDTQGYDDGTSHSFNWSTYKYGTYDNLVKYNNTDGKTTFDDEDDPVYVATSGQHKSPTKQQLQELIDYTNHEWIEIDGVKGMKFTNKNNNTKYIFIPAAGYCNGSNHNDVDSWGYIRSSSRDSGSPNYAWSMLFYSGDVDMLNYSRCYGFSVRGVLNK